MVDMIKFRCENEKKSFPSLPGEKQGRFSLLQIPTDAIFWRTGIPPTNINLSPRHVTSLNQGLSSYAPFGVKRWKTLGTRLQVFLLLISVIEKVGLLEARIQRKIHNKIKWGGSTLMMWGGTIVIPSYKEGLTSQMAIMRYITVAGDWIIEFEMAFWGER